VKVDSYECDLADPRKVGELFERAVSALGGVDILVNNAAYHQRDDIDTMTVESLDAHLAVNVRATVLLCQKFTNQADVDNFRGRGRGHGRIINMVSGQSTQPMPDELSYAMSKGAVATMTFCLGQMLKKRGITINAVNPGPVDTGWIRDALRGELKRDGVPIATPDQIADIVAFLASDAGGRVNGQVICASGSPL
jgi:3-oxoacyl-[acyl-carrier protein] reductase